MREEQGAQALLESETLCLAGAGASFRFQAAFDGSLEEIQLTGASQATGFASACGTLPVGWPAGFELPSCSLSGQPLIEQFNLRLGGDTVTCSLPSLGGSSEAAAPSAAPAQPPQPQQQQPGALSEEERLERVRAQNRAKQARWRQRRKEREAAAEQQCAAAAAAIDREKAVNQDLLLTGALLEAMRSQKDAAVALLEQGAAATGGERSGQVPGPVRAQLTQASSASGPSAGASIGFTASPPYKHSMRRMPFEQRVQQYCSTFQAAAAVQREFTRQNGEAPDWFGLDVSIRQAVSRHMVELRPQLLEAVMCMTAADVVQDWAEFCEFVAGVLLQLDAGQISEADAEARLRPAALYEAMLHALLLTHRPEHEHHLLRNVPGESEEAVQKVWHDLMLEVGFTREQWRSVLPAYEDYVSRMQRLEEEAAASLAVLQEAQQGAEAQAHRLGDARLSHMAWHYLQLFEAAGTLRHHPTAMLLALEDFFVGAGMGLTLLEKARMCIACRPYHPDFPAIVREGLLHHGLLPEDQPLPSPWGS